MGGWVRARIHRTKVGGSASLVVSVYLPTLLIATAQGAVAPVVPLFAIELGASFALAGLITGLKGLGTVIFSVPAGVITARYGERKIMVVSAVLLSLVGIAATRSPPLWLFAIYVLLLGAAWAVFNLARIAYVTDQVPNARRGRVMSTLGGIQRTGAIVGPLMGAFVAHYIGVAGGFLVQAVLAGLAVAVLLIHPEPSEQSSVRPAPVKLLGVLTRHRQVFTTAALAVAILQGLRSARDTAIPLWGAQIGLTAASISSLFAVMSAIDLAIFYPVGVAMDTRGRKSVFIPSMALLSLSIALIPLTGSTFSLGAVAILAGLGNGLSSGINLTISSDLAPSVGRSEFLGIWRLITDTGVAAGPWLIAVVGAALSFPAALAATAAVGVTGMVLAIRRVPETLVRPGHNL